MHYFLLPSRNGLAVTVGPPSSIAIETFMRTSDLTVLVSNTHSGCMLVDFGLCVSRLVLANEQRGVNVTIPNDQSKVRYLLDSITCDDIALPSRMEIVQAATSPLVWPIILRRLSNTSWRHALCFVTIKGQ